MFQVELDEASTFFFPPQKLVKDLTSIPLFRNQATRDQDVGSEIKEICLRWEGCELF